MDLNCTLISNFDQNIIKKSFYYKYMFPKFSTKLAYFKLSLRLPWISRLEINHKIGYFYYVKGLWTNKACRKQLFSKTYFTLILSVCESARWRINLKLVLMLDPKGFLWSFSCKSFLIFAPRKNITTMIFCFEIFINFVNF